VWPLAEWASSRMSEARLRGGRLRDVRLPTASPEGKPLTTTLKAFTTKLSVMAMSGPPVDRARCAPMGKAASRRPKQARIVEPRGRDGCAKAEGADPELEARSAPLHGGRTPDAGVEPPEDGWASLCFLMATRARELFGEAIVLDDFEAARAQDRRFCAACLGRAGLESLPSAAQCSLSWQDALVERAGSALLDGRRRDARLRPVAADPPAPSAALSSSLSCLCLCMFLR
jgi:hypothetical protein